MGIGNVPFYFSHIIAALFLLIILLSKGQAVLLFLINNLFGMIFPCHSAPVHVRGVSRGEWWCVRTQKVTALITVMRESNLASLRAVTQDRVLCGTMAAGER